MLKTSPATAYSFAVYAKLDKPRYHTLAVGNFSNGVTRTAWWKPANTLNKAHAASLIRWSRAGARNARIAIGH